MWASVTHQFGIKLTWSSLSHNKSSREFLSKHVCRYLIKALKVHVVHSTMCCATRIHTIWNSTTCSWIVLKSNSAHSLVLVQLLIQLLIQPGPTLKHIRKITTNAAVWNQGEIYSDSEADIVFNTVVMPHCQSNLGVGAKMNKHVQDKPRCKSKIGLACWRWDRTWWRW